MKAKQLAYLLPLALFAVGLAGLGALRRRRAR